ncbi:hypothetical protein BV898_17648 [Hypsibius exemplaris]|uniref:G-protein coupled receptors family 1 profile domain-containing protein n=1 Tax=Hypsibius exemplaris TaxID=2072580 RepID=A0A9X6NFY8_HYPEX|nr:hypothetical protein BV898_17648 [Hypsibius exemplaris]
MEIHADLHDNFSEHIFCHSNDTFHEENAQDQPRWTNSTIFALLVFLVGVMGNGSLLLLILCKGRALRTPFNVYIGNLLLANSLNLCLQCPLDIANELYPCAWNFSRGACSIFLYAALVLQAVTYSAHLLIAVNRIWAVAHPISYRSIHSVRTSTRLCLAVWILVHVCVMPRWAADVLMDHRERTFECSLEPMGTGKEIWDLVIHILFFLLPHGVITAALPVIQIVKRRRGAGAKINIVQPLAEGRMGEPTNRTPASVFGIAAVNDIPQFPKASFLGMTAAAGKRADNNGRFRGYVLLLLMTITIAACWTPMEVYYVLSDIDSSFSAPIFFEVASVLFSCQAALDPLLFTLALRNIRREIRSILLHGPQINNQCRKRISSCAVLS